MEENEDLPKSSVTVSKPSAEETLIVSLECSDSCEVKSGSSLPAGDGDDVMVQVLGSGNLKDRKIDFNLGKDVSLICETGGDVMKIRTFSSLMHIFGGETVLVEPLAIPESDSIAQSLVTVGGEATMIYEDSIVCGTNVINNLTADKNCLSQESNVPQMGEPAAMVKMGYLTSKYEVPVYDVVDRSVPCAETDPISDIGFVHDAENSGSMIHEIQGSDGSGSVGVMKEVVLSFKTDVVSQHLSGQIERHAVDKSLPMGKQDSICSTGTVEHCGFVESPSSVGSDYENSKDDPSKEKSEIYCSPIVHSELSAKETKNIESECHAVSSINGVENKFCFTAKDQELEADMSRRSMKNDDFVQQESCTLVDPTVVVKGEILSTNSMEISMSMVGFSGIDNVDIGVCSQKDEEVKFVTVNELNIPQIEHVIDMEQSSNLHKHQVMHGEKQIKSIKHLNVVRDSEDQIAIDGDQFGYYSDRDIQNTGQQAKYDEETNSDNDKHLSLHELQLKEAKEVEFEVEIGEKIVVHETEVEKLQPPDPEAVFFVSDLVWGKIRSHRWWPGQIFDPSESSEQAIKYYKKGCYLVSYFGDQTFSWNNASELKPFCGNFSRIVNHNTSEAFKNAVYFALQEVSRRVELALACSCIPKEIHNKISYQIIKNTGICQESSSADFSSGVDSFEPARLLDFLKELAKITSSIAVDRLDLAIAKSELLSLWRFKGYDSLSEFQFFRGIEDGLESIDFDSHYGKPKHDLKERSLLHLMGEHYSERNDSNPSQKPSFKVGECISRVANQLTRFPSILTLSSEKKDTFDQESLSPHELLSLLDSAARDPKNSYNSLRSISNFFFDFRNHMVLNSHNASRKKESPGTFEFEDMKDSYWTDRIIHSSEQKPSRRGKKRNRTVLKPIGCCLYGNNYELAAKRPAHDLSPTELILRFSRIDNVPGERNLNNMFRRFGALNELETEVDWVRGRARVVFKRCSDAEVAFTSAGPFNIFGSEAVNYELCYSPSLSFKSMPLAITGGHDP